MLVPLPSLPRGRLPFLRVARAEEAKENGTGTVVFLLSPRCDIADDDRRSSFVILFRLSFGMSTGFLAAGGTSFIAIRIEIEKCWEGED